jgi:hypothetical protein
MPSQLHCTGPAHIFVYIPRAGGSVRYLGTCEDAPRIQVKRAFRPVLNDIAGDEPLDLSYLGRSAMISLPLNRYDEAVYALIDAMPNAQAIRRGEEIEGDVGTLMSQEGASCVLYVQFPYATKPAMAVGGMPRGYRFIRAVQIGPDDLFPLGTKARKVHLMFHAIRAYDPKTGHLKLFDHDVTGLPALT